MSVQLDAEQLASVVQFAEVFKKLSAERGFKAEDLQSFLNALPAEQTKIYKKMCLLLHPDKGDAFNLLLNPPPPKKKDDKESEEERRKKAAEAAEAAKALQEKLFNCIQGWYESCTDIDKGESALHYARKAAGSKAHEILLGVLRVLKPDSSVAMSPEDKKILIAKLKATLSDSFGSKSFTLENFENYLRNSALRDGIYHNKILPIFDKTGKFYDEDLLRLININYEIANKMDARKNISSDELNAATRAQDILMSVYYALEADVQLKQQFKNTFKQCIENKSLELRDLTSFMLDVSYNKMLSLFDKGGAFYYAELIQRIKAFNEVFSQFAQGNHVNPDVLNAGNDAMRMLTGVLSDLQEDQHQQMLREPTIEADEKLAREILEKEKQEKEAQEKADTQFARTLVEQEEREAARRAEAIAKAREEAQKAREAEIEAEREVFVHFGGEDEPIDLEEERRKAEKKAAKEAEELEATLRFLREEEAAASKQKPNPSKR
jgi:hypothetical protein